MARATFDRCRACAKHAGLRMDTWASNEALVAFHERQGFHVVARRRIGMEPRLPAYHYGNEFTLLEDPRGREVR